MTALRFPMVDGARAALAKVVTPQTQNLLVLHERGEGSFREE